MRATDITEAARRLLAARRELAPLGDLPAALAPQDLSEGYAIQDAFVALSGDRPVGYKLACTSAKAQQVIGVSAPFVGRVLACDLLASPAQPAAGRFNFALIEPEFALSLATALPADGAPYDDAQVAQSIGAVHPAIEIVTSGLDDWSNRGGPALAADNAAQGALVLGPALAAWRDLDLPSHPVTLTINGEQRGQGQGRNALGGPVAALTWLANELAARGRGLAPGQVVTTGVVTDFLVIGAGDRAVADFGTLGRVEVTLQD